MNRALNPNSVLGFNWFFVGFNDNPIGWANRDSACRVYEHSKCRRLDYQGGAGQQHHLLTSNTVTLKLTTMQQSISHGSIRFLVQAPVSSGTGTQRGTASISIWNIQHSRDHRRCLFNVITKVWTQLRSHPKRMEMPAT